MLDFNNTEVAFSIKSGRDLRRAFWMYKLISYRILVKIANPLIWFASVIRFPINWIVKPTVYKQFVGGEALEECEPVVEKLMTGKVYSILDYSVEGKEDDADIQAALEETLRNIDFAAKNDYIPFTVFKPTAFAKSHALEVMSTSENPDEESMREGEKFRERVNQLCSRAHQHGIPIMIDAEDSFYQEFIDRVVMEMMEKYNKETAIVFNTYQMYRHDRLERLKSDHRIATKKKFFLGAKFVRGAYMEKERERAEKMGYEDPIQPDKAATDRDYNLALKYTIENIKDFHVFNGTHNEESSRYMTEVMEANGIARDDSRCWFSQLYGMSDHISFNLAEHGYNVVKYVPYGPVKHVLPYLMRRVEENTSVKGQTSRELSLLKKEKKRRRGIK
jgi:proline dehydrogenase